MIAYGEADVMVCGGSESLDTPLNIAGFSALRALSTDNDNPTGASRPFDATRNGFVLAEGACALVLESLEHAQARGARIYAELKGFGMSGDAHHITAPSGDGAVRAMRFAIEDASLQPTDIGHINPHATSTPVGDAMELEALKALFGEHIANMSISATKSMTGHLLGATGALECMFSIQALVNQHVPPTINLQEPIGDPAFNLVPNVGQDQAFDAVLCNSFGFGGTNASIVFTRV
jgi:3-oxoacyl-[acyl-carrier-protein] synthase II